MTLKELYTRRALDRLREARDLLTAAESPRALDKVRKAMKSTEGAIRHAGRDDLFPTRRIEQ